MAVYFQTDAARTLLDHFNARIDQSEAKGKITTWERSDDGKCYTHTAADWRKKAWFRPKVETERLVFNIIKPKNADVSTVTYGYYHGHLIETFLNHFDGDFEQGRATARATSGDNCSD